MLVARVYTVMDAAVVEVSCVHGTDPTQSHLVIREERRPIEGSLRSQLRALGDVADLASTLMRSRDDALRPGSLEECYLSPINPCD